MYPGFDVCQTGGEGGEGGVGDSFSEEVELCVVSIAKAMAGNDLSKWEDIEYEEEGSKHQALGDTMSNRSSD